MAGVSQPGEVTLLAKKLRQAKGWCQIPNNSHNPFVLGQVGIRTAVVLKRSHLALLILDVVRKVKACRRPFLSLCILALSLHPHWYDMFRKRLAQALSIQQHGFFSNRNKCCLFAHGIDHGKTWRAHGKIGLERKLRERWFNLQTIMVHDELIGLLKRGRAHWHWMRWKLRMITQWILESSFVVCAVFVIWSVLLVDFSPLCYCILWQSHSSTTAKYRAEPRAAIRK